MKKLLWTSAMALAAVACLTACDDSSSGSSNSGIPEYKMVANLPDSCEMEVAKVDTAYFACFENKWIEVTDSATIEQFKDGMDESKIKEKLEELENQLKPSAPAKPKASTSKEEDVESSDDSEEIESSDSEVECTGRRCKTGKSSSSRSSGGNSGGESGHGGGGSGGGDDESSSSGDVGSSSSSSDDESSSSGDVIIIGSSSSDVSSSSAVIIIIASSSSGPLCGGVVYDPETEWCRTTDYKVIAIANTGCCGKLAACHSSREDSPEIYYDRTSEFCATYSNTPNRIYKMVTIGDGENAQTWMAENLAYKTENAVYYNNNASYSSRGYFYLSTEFNACPTGWHVPTLQEWQDGIAIFASPADFKDALQITITGLYWDDSWILNGAEYWTTTPNDDENPSFYKSIFFGAGMVYPQEKSNEMYSVRCKKD